MTYASVLLAALALAGTWPAAEPSPCDIIIRVPPEAKGRLESHEPRDAALTSQSLMSDGRLYDCWVFGVEPGDDVTLTVETRAFRPAVAVLPTPVCDGRTPIYSDQASGAPLRQTSVTFNAQRNAFAVLVSSREPGAGGRYRITFTQEPPEDAPAGRVYTPSEPERLVRSLYDDGRRIDFGDPAFIDRTMAPATAEALKALIDRTNGVGLGFDFLVDGQDSAITEPRISTRVWLARSSLVDVRFSSMGRPVHLQFHMRETPAGWRVEDIESRDRDNDQNWVLSQLLGLDLGVAVARQP